MDGIMTANNALTIHDCSLADGHALGESVCYALYNAGRRTFVNRYENNFCKFRMIRPLLDVGVKDAVLFEVVGHGVLGQERVWEANLGADPLAFGVGLVWGVVATAAAAKLRAEIGGVDLVEVVEFFPRGIADGVGDVDFEL